MCFSWKKSTKWPTVIGRHTWTRQSQRLKSTSWKCCRSGSVKQNQLTWQSEHDRFPCLRKMVDTSGSDGFTEVDQKIKLGTVWPQQHSTWMLLFWSFMLISCVTYSWDTIKCTFIKWVYLRLFSLTVCVKSSDGTFEMRAFLAFGIYSYPIAHCAPSRQLYSIWQDDKIEGHQLLCE